MKYCNDCKHHHLRTTDFLQHLCYQYLDVIGRGSDCLENRADENICGAEAKGWEAVPPKPPRITWFDKFCNFISKIRNLG